MKTGKMVILAQNIVCRQKQQPPIGDFTMTVFGQKRTFFFKKYVLFFSF